MKKIGNFFLRIGQWIKATAWIQVIGIVGIVVGVIVAVPYAVRGIQSWVATLSESKFYQNSRIDYDKYKELTTGTHDNDIIVFFYEDDCAHCATDQKWMESFYNQFHYDEDTKFEFYTINVAWEDEENDNQITKDQLDAVGETLFSVYKTQTDPKILGNYPDINSDEVRNLGDPYSFPTPTIVLIRDGGVSAVRLGFDADTYDGVYAGMYYLLTGEEL